MRLPLIELLRSASHPRSETDLSAFSSHDVEWALYTGLGPLMRHTVTFPNGDLTRRSDQDALLGADLTARLLTDNLLDALHDILNVDLSLARRTTLLKGAAMCERYPAPHLRTMGDLDLLVDESLQRSLESVLRTLGYEQRSDYPASFYATLHHSMPFFHPQRGVWVEVHTALFPPSTPVARDHVYAPAHLQTQTVAHSFRGVTTQRLNDEMQLIYTCSHWARSLNIQRGLTPLLDTLRLLNDRDTALDWDSILDWTKGALAAAHLYLVLSYLQRKKLATLPDGVLERLASSQTVLNRCNLSVLHAIVDRFLIGGNPFGPWASAANVNTVWKALLAPRGAWHNLAAIPWRLAFPPNEPRRFQGRYQLSRVVSALGWRR